MKRLLIIAILAVAGTTAMAQTQQNRKDKQQTTKEKTLYVIDGQIASEDAFEKLPSDRIKNIEVLKGIEGAIVVNTKDGDYGKGDVIQIKSYKLSGKVAEYWKVDDPEFDSTKVKKVITVSKDKDGNMKSEEKREDGSVLIRLKNNENKPVDVKVNPLIIVKNAKGEISVAGNMEEIKPENIKAISVIKDNSAEPYAKYGNIKYGVIVVELK